MNRLLPILAVLLLAATTAAAQTRTLFVARFADAGHVQRSTQYRDYLLQKTPFDDWYVVHGERDSTLYNGRFAADEAARLEERRGFIAAITDADRRPMFPDLAVVELGATPRTAGPEAFDLANAQGRWTVVVAAYADHPDREKFAVEAATAARRMGLEAYFWHGPSVSHVTLGAFPDAAAREVNPVAERATGDEGQAVLIGGMALPEDIRDENGRKMKVVQARFEINDVELKELLERFPVYSVNGEEATNQVRQPDGRVKVLPKPTYIADLRQLAGRDAGESAPVPAADRTPDLLGRQRQNGGLRSLDGE